MQIDQTYGAYGQLWILHNSQDVTHHVIITEHRSANRSIFGDHSWWQLELSINGNSRYRSFTNYDKAIRFAHLWLVITGC